MKQKYITLIRIFAIVALFVSAGLMPLLLPQYNLNMLTEIIIFALFAVSYNLLLGYAGLLSFGHAMFFGVGAYMTAIAIIHLPGLPIWSAVLIAIGATIVVGAVIGALLLRAKGAYFSLLTLAFNALFYAIATKWTSMTGGDDGLGITRPDLSLGFTIVSMATITNFFYLTLIVIGMGTLFCWYFTHTAMGGTVLLMRENEDRMKMLGYNTNISRLFLFIFTGAVAGLAGSFYTLHFRFVSLSAIDPMDVGATVLLITFVGGMKTFWGPIVGAFVYIMLQNYLSTVTDRWPLLIGLVFVLMVLFIPGGLSEVIVNMYQRFFGRKDRNDSASAAAEEAKS